MDSKQSLEFIRTLIARSENEPEIKEMLKKATLMNKVAQVFSAFDDGHLENLYEMNVNRAGAKMFLQALKGQGKAPKQVVIQSHPNHVGDFKKFFPSTVPFAVKQLSMEKIDWDGSVETKSKQDAMGFYNDLSVLVSYLKDVGFQAPFSIKPTGKSELTLTYVEEPAESRLMYDNLIAAAEALKANMVAEKATFEKAKALKLEVARLQEDWEDFSQEEEDLRKISQDLNWKAVKFERMFNKMEHADPNYEDAKKMLEDKKEEHEKSLAEVNKMVQKRQEAFRKFEEKKEELKAMQSSELKERIRVWDSLDWNGGTPTLDQLGRLIAILGREYSALRGKLPYKKTIVVKLSCAIKSSSGGYEQGNFKNLKDFIKLSIF